MKEHKEHMQEQTFGDYLREERESAGLTLRSLSKASGLAPSTLSRWENNHVDPARADVVKVDQGLRANGRVVSNWELLTSVRFPPWMRNVSRLEEVAHLIELISPLLVPGLLQSPLYAHEVFREGLHQGTPEEIGKLIALRTSRLERLRSSNNPLVTAVFPVTALTCVPDAVRSEQATRLLELSESDRISIHLVPEGTVLMGVVSHLLMFHLRDGGRAAVADHVDGATLYEDRKSYVRLEGLVKSALGSALPAKQSRKTLEELL
ncbi:helix-turn-helix transcriptional regulator [Nocardiopsis sp. CC223A]|uniref:helix-turn-helix domain-containing protein n=1 Tax=Nocardiopsis sp. CC223A TaxID=3044051 RepID=UPI00278C2CF1|nr:helix-turn-helix transcriptional regulator [Nocardiopsis sp. CC223A]